VGVAEDLYKRDEDRKWRELTDERIKNLTTDMTVVQDQQEYLEGKLSELLKLIRGGADSRDQGINGDIQEAQKSIRRMEALLLPAYGQEEGIIPRRLNTVEKHLGISVKRTELHWKFITAVAVAAISTLGLLLREWPDLRDQLFNSKPDKLEQMLEKAKKPRRRHRVIAVPKESVERKDSPDAGTPKETMPQ